MDRRPGYAFVLCTACGQDLPNGGAHIVMSPVNPDLHQLYCPGCCPCQATRPSAAADG